MEDISLEELLPAVKDALLEAGDLIRSLNRPEVYSKEGHANFVTEGDLKSQQLLFQRLKPLLPKANFFAEEQAENQLLPGYNWIIDPIDGTTNFMRGLNQSTISVGLVLDGIGVLGAVYQPYTGELFSGVQGKGSFCGDRPMHVSDRPLADGLVCFGTSPYYRELVDSTFDHIKRLFCGCGDLRRSGSAALDLCFVADGRCDGFYEARLSPWDYAAAAVILKEAGGILDTLPPYTFGFTKKIPIIAASRVAYSELCALLAE